MAYCATSLLSSIPIWIKCIKTTLKLQSQHSKGWKCQNECCLGNINPTAYANALRYSLNFITTHFFPALSHPASVCTADSTRSYFKFYFLLSFWRLIKLKKNGHIIWQWISQTFAASEETGISFQAADRGMHRRRPYALVLTYLPWPNCPAPVCFFPMPSTFFSHSQPSHFSLLIQGPNIPCCPICSRNLPNIFHVNTLHSKSRFLY